MDLYTIRKKYPTQKKRIELLEEIRWGDEPTCPKCGCPKVYKTTWRQGYWKCRPCNREYTVFVGTIFEHTKLSLEKWFDMLFYICSNKRGLPSINLSRYMGIDRRHAWTALMRIRIAMREWNFELQGEVEADEMYYGPKKHRKRTKNMLPQEPGTDLTLLTSVEKWGHFPRGKGTIKKQVVGVVERKGKVAARTFLEKKASPVDLFYMIKENVKMADSILYTDQATEYLIMDQYMQHASVNHSKKEYARDAVHTNQIEGVWSHFKGILRGSHIRVDNEYLPFYLAEFCYRYNRRGMSSGEMFWDLLGRCVMSHKYFLGGKPTEDPETLMYDMASYTNVVECQEK